MDDDFQDQQIGDDDEGTDQKFQRLFRRSARNKKKIEAVQVQAEEFQNVLKKLEKDVTKLKKEGKETKKELSSMASLLQKNLPKSLPVELSCNRMSNVETPPVTIKLRGGREGDYSASEYIVESFLQTPQFQTANRDLISFTNKACVAFTKMFNDEPWTVSKGTQRNQTFTQLPNEFITDVITVGLIGSGASTDKKNWTQDEREAAVHTFNVVINQLQNLFGQIRKRKSGPSSSTHVDNNDEEYE